MNRSVSIRKPAVFLSITAALAIALLFFSSRIEHLLPDTVHAMLSGGPAITLDINALLTAGAEPRDTYRSRWLADHSARPTDLTNNAKPKRLCRDLIPDCDFISLDEAFGNITNGDVLIISSGVYEEAAVLKASSLNIRA